MAVAAGFFVAVAARGAARAARGAARGIVGGEPADLRTLMIRSTPAGAAILLDGERLGVTPSVVDVRLDDGQHQLELAVPNGPSGQRKLSLKKSDRFLVVSENLLAAGKLIIDTRPQGARLLLDGADVGRSPLTLEKVSTDKTHIVEARLDGHAAQTAPVPIDRGASHHLMLTLPGTRGEGRVVLRSSPPAEIVVDGQPWGRTGDEPRTASAGLHEIDLVVPGLPGQRSYTIDVPAQGVARYFFELNNP